MDLEKIALFDMDGTLCDYEQGLMHELNPLASPEEPPFIPFYRDIPDHIERRIQLIWKRPGWWTELAPIEIGFHVFRTAAEIGFENRILTKGPSTCPAAWGEKVIWCRNNIPTDIPYLVTITEDKGLVYGRVLVDDYPKYIERWLQWRLRGLVIMPAHRYNEDFRHPNVCRFDGSNDTEMRERLQEAFDR